MIERYVKMKWALTGGMLASMKYVKSLWWKISVLIIAVLAMGVLVSLLLSRYGLMVTRFALSQLKLSEPLRIVQLTDLHNSEFGKGNARLIRKVAEQEPDLILLTGDMLNQYEERTDVPVNLIRELSQIAPVYASYGNHERQHERVFGSDLRAAFTEAGATFLNREWVDLEIKDQELRIGGIYSYCLPAYYMQEGNVDKLDVSFLQEFCDTERTKLLLCHMPVCWIRSGGLDYWDTDYVFAGHAHGGQVRIPFVGGLYAPDQGIFPGWCEGLFFSEDGSHTMALSRGLGTGKGRIPRLNNIPEILVLELDPA